MAPVRLVVDAVVDCDTISLPAYTFSVTPRPPAEISAPVVIEVDVVVAAAVAMPATFSVVPIVPEPPTTTLPPMPAFSFTPRPPSVRMAPVRLVVDAVVASHTRSPPTYAFSVTPRPPEVTSAPVREVVAVVVAVTVDIPAALNVPPTNAFSFTPRPPDVTSEPVVVVVDVVVAAAVATPSRVEAPSTVN